MVGLVASCLGLLPLTANGLPKCVESRAGGDGGYRRQTSQKPTNKQTNVALHLAVVAPAPGFQTGVGAGAQVGIVIAAVAKLVAHVGY